MKRATSKRLHEAALSLPSLGWLLVFFLLPTLIVAWIAFRPYDYRGVLGVGEGWSTASIRSVIDKDYPRIVLRTLWVSLATTATCILLALPMAYHMARLSVRARRTVLMLTIIPFWTSFIIRIFAWMQVLHTDGLIKRGLVLLGLLAPDATLMFNLGAVLLVMIYTSLPFAILPLYAAAEKFDFQLMDAAMDLGASRWRALRATFLPGVRSGILFATLMVLVPNLGCYVASEVIGGTDCVLLGNRIKECALDFRNLPYACALSLFLMLGIGASTALLLGLARRAAPADARGPAAEPPPPAGEAPRASPGSRRLLD